MEKMTKKKAVEFVLSNCGNLPDEVTAKLWSIVDALEKKSGSARKPTARQTENEDLKAIILDGMETDGKYTVTEIMKFEGMPEDISNQRVAAIVRQMMNDDKTVDKTVEKRKSYFFRVD